MQALPFLTTDGEAHVFQKALEDLSKNKISWEEFDRRVPGLLAVSRLTTHRFSRTLLHLAIFENRLDIVAALEKDSILKVKRDAFGLSPIDIARFLHRTEALQHLGVSEKTAFVPADSPLDSFQYLSVPIFKTTQAFDQVLARVEKAKAGDQIPTEKIWMGIYFNKEIERGIPPPISIRFIDDAVGYGVFADKKIPACTYVGEYTGEVREATPRQLREKKYCLRYTIWGSRGNFAIDAEKEGSFARFFNHSASPNLGLQSVYWRGVPRMIFISLQEIPEGSQLFFDYGPVFWKYSSESPRELANDL